MGAKSFYGWPIAVFSGIMYFCTSSAVLAGAQLINPNMIGNPNLDLSATIIGLGFTVFILIQGFGAPVAGWVYGKLGARKTMSLGGFMCLAGALLMAFVVKDAVLYIIVFGIFMSLGTLMAGQISVQSTVGAWFARFRGRAMTIAMTIGKLASFVIPVVVGAAIANGGYQTGWMVLAGFGLVALLVAALLIRDTPASVGQVIDGVSSEYDVEVGSKGETKSVKVYQNPESVPYKQALRTPKYWLIALAGAGGFAAFSLTTSTGVLHFTTQGYATDLIVAAAALYGLANIAGAIIFGSVSDRINPLTLIKGALVFDLIAILLAAFVTSDFVVYFYYIVVGVCTGCITTVLPTCVANYFGPGEFSKNLGTTMFTTGVSTSFIGVMGGAIFDSTGSCVMAFAVIAVFVVGSLICGCLVKTPKANN